MYITMGTAVYGYICYEFLGLFEARRVDPEMGHTGILADHATKNSSRSEILKFMHAIDRHNSEP